MMTTNDAGWTVHRLHDGSYAISDRTGNIRGRYASADVMAQHLAAHLAKANAARLTWTTRLPETAGLYWWRQSPTSEATVLHVSVWHDGGLAVPLAGGGNWSPERVGGEWSSGAIPLPGD